jgi:hypothetical protein
MNSLEASFFVAFWIDLEIRSSSIFAYLWVSLKGIGGINVKVTSWLFSGVLAGWLSC